VAATEIQSLHRGPFAYDRSAPLSAHCSTHFEHPVGATHRYSDSRNSNRPELIRSWSEKTSSEGFYGKDFMSKQSGDRGLQGSSTRPETDAGRPSTSLAHFSQHGQQPTPSTLPGISSNATRQPQSQSGIQLPPLPQATNVTSGSFPPPRSVGLPSILNPSTEQEQPRGQRRKADQLDSPPSSIASLPPLITSAQPNRHEPRSDTPSNQHASVSQVPQNRSVITPRSPALHRPATYQSFHPPTGTISALRSPFPTSPRARSYTIESGAQNFPTPPVVPRPTYEYAMPQSDNANASRRASLGGVRLNRAPSSSASPSTSYSSFSQAGGLDERHRQMGIPISSSSGQNVYQMMTLETTSGTVQLPVDVQAASKVADEKRKRNAGASARFRQRRKEKERESSTTISKLEQRLKAAADDADFYKRERDYLAGVLLQIPGGDRHFPRPQSPRHRRSSTITSAMSASGSAGYLSGSEQFAPRSPEQGRNVRRRTSVHSLPPPPPPPQMSMSGPPSTPGFAGPQYARTPLAPQPPQYHPGSTTLPSPLGGGGASHLPPPSQPPQHPGSSTLMQAPPQTGPWNPYASRHTQPPRTQ
jgi:hypothetical protein